MPTSPAKRLIAPLLVFLTVCALAGGCTSEHQTSACAGRVKFDGRVYMEAGLVQLKPDSKLGQLDLLPCAGQGSEDTLPRSAGKTKGWTAKGVDPEVAILVGDDGDHLSLYGAVNAEGDINSKAKQLTQRK